MGGDIRPQLATHLGPPRRICRGCGQAALWMKRVKLAAPAVVEGAAAEEHAQEREAARQHHAAARVGIEEALAGPHQAPGECAPGVEAAGLAATMSVIR